LKIKIYNDNILLSRNKDIYFLAEDKREGEDI